METEFVSTATFGGLLRDARRRRGLSQKDVAGRVVKDNGEAISPQYLNDIEHDRRNPPAESILRQLASLLGLNEDRVFFAADRVPADIRRLAIQEPVVVEEAFELCRAKTRRPRR